MATIEKRGKSYRISVSNGYDINGKQIREKMTWTPEPGMTRRQLEKALNREATLFEERVRTQQIHGGSIKLVDFEDRWMKDYAAKNLKPRTINYYSNLRIRIDQALGHIALEKIQPRHLLDFYSQLDAGNIRQDTKFSPAVDFRSLLKEKKLTQAAFAAAAGISTGTVEMLVKGRNVSANSAMKISQALDTPIAKLFTPNSGGKLSGKTKLSYHRYLSVLLETAVQWQIIASNPCDRVKAPRADRKETTYLDDAGAVALISALDDEPILYRTVVLLAINTGLRRAEICGLTWSDLDLDHATLTVRQNTVYIPKQGVVDNTPKTKVSARTIKMPRNCVPMLREYKAWQTTQRLKVGDLWKEQGRVFARWDGDPIHPDTLTGWFSDFIKRHDLPKITFHGLRHTNATLLIAAGTNLRTVASRLGHSQTSTTANIYAHAIQSADAAAADELDDILSHSKKAQ